MPFLSAGETLVTAEYSKYGSKTGTLSLTSKRVVFESQSGVFSKNTFVNADFPLTAVQDVAIEGRLTKKVLFILRRGNSPLRYEFTVNDPEQWRNKALEAIGLASESASASSIPLVKEKEVIIKEIVKIPCRYCGTLIVNTDTYCSSCGAALK